LSLQPSRNLIKLLPSAADLARLQVLAQLQGNMADSVHDEI